MWKELKKMSRWKRKEQTSTCVWNKEKKEVEGKEAMKEWKDTFEELGKENLEDTKFDTTFAKKIITKLQTQIHHSQELKIMDDDTLDQEITEDETTQSIQMLKIGKSAGIDNIIPEMLTRGGEEIERYIGKLCQKIWTTEQIPEEWRKGIICPIFKEGDEKDTSNYRGITLTNSSKGIHTNSIPKDHDMGRKESHNRRGTKRIQIFQRMSRQLVHID